MSFKIEFKNWAQNIDFRPRALLIVESLSNLINFINKANIDNRRVRVLGSGWSFSDVAISHDYLVDLHPLNHILALSYRGKRWGHATQAAVYPSRPIQSRPPESPVLNDALRPELFDMNRRFAHVLGGMTIKELYLSLDSPQWDTDEDAQFVNTRDRWTLPTMGGSAGQTIAGAVSTSTHGADFKLPPLHEMVRAIDLIAPDGTRHWFERTNNNSITDPLKLKASFSNDAVPLSVLHYDDIEFQSVLVSMGCMGIIHSLIIEVVPQFGLSQRVGTSTWLTIRDSLPTGFGFSFMGELA